MRNGCRVFCVFFLQCRDEVACVEACVCASPRVFTGIPLPENEQRWSQAIEAMKGVWASKYNDRAYYSLRKVSVLGPTPYKHRPPIPRSVLP